MKFQVDRDEFKTLIDMASELNETIPVKVEEGKLVVSMYDAGHTRALVADFVIDGMVNFEPIEFGIMSEMMAKKLNSTRSGAIKCELRDAMFIMKQRTTIAEINLDQEHRLVYIDDSALEAEGVKYPGQQVTDLTTFIKMPNASALKEIFNAIDTEYFSLMASKDKLIVEASGVGEGHESEFTLEIPVTIKGESDEARYSAEVVKAVVKYLPSEANITLKFGTERPLIVNSMGDKNTVEVSFAPIIEQ